MTPYSPNRRPLLSRRLQGCLYTSTRPKLMRANARPSSKKPGSLSEVSALLGVGTEVVGMGKSKPPPPPLFEDMPEVAVEFPLVGHGRAHAHGVGHLLRLGLARSPCWRRRCRRWPCSTGARRWRCWGAMSLPMLDMSMLAIPVALGLTISRSSQGCCPLLPAAAVLAISLLGVSSGKHQASAGPVI